MHAVFFNRSFFPDVTATGQLLTELCEGLAEDHGWRVSVVAGLPLSPLPPAPGGSRTSSLVQREALGSIAILRARGTRFSKHRFVGRFSNYVTYFLSACCAGLRLDRPDVVIALTDPPVIGLAGYLAARRFGVPFVMSFRDVFPEVARLLEDFQSEAVNRVLLAVNRFLVRRAEVNVTLGETMRRRLVEGKGADPGRTIVIPDWIDTAAVVPGPRENAFSARHGLTGKFVVMHSGNIGLSQGLETLVEAADRLRHVPDIEIVFVGDGVKKPRLEQMARAMGLTNVQFLPYQPKEALTESFASADVFIVSLLPGLAGYIVPSKLYGILAAGRPYIATVDEESEVVSVARDHGCGLLAGPSQPAEMAERILTLYHDRALTKTMGENARLASARFDRRRLIGAYHELLSAVARRGELPPSLRSPA